MRTYTMDIHGYIMYILSGYTMYILGYTWYIHYNTLYGISKDIPYIYHTYTIHMDEDTICHGMVYTIHIPGRCGPVPHAQTPCIYQHLNRNRAALLHAPPSSPPPSSFRTCISVIRFASPLQDSKNNLANDKKRRLAGGSVEGARP
jgi:hypothetical protein